MHPKNLLEHVHRRILSNNCSKCQKSNLSGCTNLNDINQDVCIWSDEILFAEWHTAACRCTITELNCDFTVTASHGKHTVHRRAYWDQEYGIRFPLSENTFIIVYLGAACTAEPVGKYLKVCSDQAVTDECQAGTSIRKCPNTGTTEKNTTYYWEEQGHAHTHLNTQQSQHTQANEAWIFSGIFKSLKINTKHFNNKKHKCDTFFTQLLVCLHRQLTCGCCDVSWQCGTVTVSQLTNIDSKKQIFSYLSPEKNSYTNNNIHKTLIRFGLETQMTFWSQPITASRHNLRDLIGTDVQDQRCKHIWAVWQTKFRSTCAAITKENKDG